MTARLSSAQTKHAMPSQADIAARAYEIWRAHGAGHGHHEDDWRQAEEELREEGRERARPALAFSVLLAGVGDNKIGVIRELRETVGLDLAAAKTLVDRVPQTLTEVASRAEAEAIRHRLAAVGAVVEVVSRS
jgi:ribosomal protein L7/L12